MTDRLRLLIFLLLVPKTRCFDFFCCVFVVDMNTPSESTMTLDSQDLDQLLAANLPEDALQIAATTFSGVEDERLSAAAREASQHGTQMPLVREELRNRILLRRHHDGMPPIQPEFAPPKDYQVCTSVHAVVVFDRRRRNFYIYIYTYVCIMCVCVCVCVCVVYIS